MVLPFPTVGKGTHIFLCLRCYLCTLAYITLCFNIVEQKESEDVIRTQLMRTVLSPPVDSLNPGLVGRDRASNDASASLTEDDAEGTDLSSVFSMSLVDDLFPETLQCFERCTAFMSRELMWKVSFEKAQMICRAGELMEQIRTSQQQSSTTSSEEQKDPPQVGVRKALPPVAETGWIEGDFPSWLSPVRACYVEAIANCPAALQVRLLYLGVLASHIFVLLALWVPLQWKVWAAGARTEVRAGDIAVARQLLARTLVVAPGKAKVGSAVGLGALDVFNGPI